MMKQIVPILLILSFSFLVAASPCWAKTNGYLYVVSYSFAQKKTFLSKVIIQKVRDVSYSDDEYVSEVELTQKMEAKFTDHLVSTEKVNPSEYTTTVRGPYKSKAIADRKLNIESEQFTKKGYSATVQSDFEYSD
jgi:hypothetical protein